MTFLLFTDVQCITAHENFDAVCLNRDVLWAALVSLHDRNSAGLPNRNQVTNRQVYVFDLGYHRLLK